MELEKFSEKALVHVPNTWAIQLENSDNRKWVNNDEADLSQITFEWSEVTQLKSKKKGAILVAVGQAHPKYSLEEVENIANTISSTQKIKPGDFVIGVNGEERVSKVGHFTEARFSLSNKASETAGFKGIIAWIDDYLPTFTNSPVFNPSALLERVTENMRDQIDNSVFKFMDYAPSFHRQYYEIDASEIDNLVEEAQIPYGGKEDKGGKITLFYGTNRNITGSTSFNDFFGSEVSELSYGTCDVDIPKGHVQGNLEKPRKLIWSFPERKDKHIMIAGITQLDYPEFISTYLNSFTPGDEKTGFVFVHGFNTSFADAAKRTAQIAWDLPFDGIAAFFSWPSSGVFLSYPADSDKADASIKDFEQFIKTIAQNTGIEKLHIIAHSMGNKVLTYAMSNLASDPTFANNLPVIHQIVLGAPDLDQDVFNNTLMPHFNTVGSARTIYASDQDQALAFSRSLRGQRARLGDAGRTIFVAQGIDTIDASNVPSGGTHHGYIFETKELLADLYYLLGQGFTPVQRRLRAVPKGGLSYWLFPK